MKISILSMVISVLLINPGYPSEDKGSETDRGYALLNEAYQSRREGDQEEAQKKLALALDIFRRNTSDNLPGSVASETEYILERTPKKINLIENKTLFKIEFRNDDESRKRDSKNRDETINQQQMILQTLILLTRENAELKKAISRIETNTEEIDKISDIVNDINDETSNIDDLNDQIEDVKDDTNDIQDSVDELGDGNNGADRSEDIADDVSDLRDDMDILKDILNIVEDIKNDTDNIKDLEDKIEEVKDSVEDGNSEKE
ncbi:MAG: hypothetical protein U9N73_11350 [Candidatus Auribacterota bacterium]|nr:hypothetical protein [Candidatus Auribacterota bacterium]